VYALRGNAEPRHTRIATLLGPVADRVAATFDDLLNRTWRTTQPLRRPARAYTRLLGVAQDWRMFANPPLVNTHLVARLHLTNDAGSDVHIVEEVLLPSARHGVHRLDAFRLSYRDKALSNALDAFDSQQRESTIPPDATTASGADPLGPVARWATSRYELRASNQGRRIARTELWRADVPVRLVGTPVKSTLWVLVDSRGWN
jgi:hypothetical protein